MSDANKGLYVSGSPPAPAPASPTSTPEKDERYANTVSSLLPPPAAGGICPEWGHVPSAGSRSAFCSRPPASTDTGTVYFFTSSLLFLTLHPGHCQTQTLAVLSHLQTPREQRPSTETSLELSLSVQTSNRSVLGALAQAHWPPPASVYAAAPCCAGRKTSPSWRGIFLQNIFSIP